MPFDKRKIQRTTTDRISRFFRQFHYTTADTIDAVMSAGYFDDMPYDPDGMYQIFVECSDGAYFISYNTETGETSYVNGDVADKSAEVAALEESVSAIISESELVRINLNPKQVGVMGDSKSATSPVSNEIVDSVWAYWFRGKLNSEYYLSKSSWVAVGGADTSHMLSVQLPRILDSNCGVCFIAIGINNIINESIDSTADEVLTDVSYAVDKLVNRGVKVGLMPVMPTVDVVNALGANYVLNDEKKSRISAINAGYLEIAQSNELVTFYSAISDFIDYETGNAKPEYYRDGLHDNKEGAQVYGEKIYQQFAEHLGLVSDADYKIGGNKYDATSNPNGNLSVNPYLTGTGGSLSRGATGIVADSSIVQRITDSGDLQVTASKGTLNGKPAQVISVFRDNYSTGSYVADIENGCQFVMGSSSITIPAAYKDRDILRASITVKAEDMTSLEHFNFSLGLGSRAEKDGTTTSSYGDYPADFERTFSVDFDFYESANAYITLSATIAGDESVNGTITITDVQISRVVDYQYIDKFNTKFNDVTIASGTNGAVTQTRASAVDIMVTEGNSPVLSTDLSAYWYGPTMAKCQITHDGSGNNESYRSELTKWGGDTFGEFYEYKVAQYLAADFSEIEAGDWTIINQIHSTPDAEDGALSPQLAMQVDGGRYTLVIRSDSRPATPTGDFEVFFTVDLGPIDIERHFSWRYIVKWSYEDDGELYVYKDGELVYKYLGPNSYNDDIGPYFKAGIYNHWRYDTQTPTYGALTRTMYIGEMVSRKLINGFSL